ncbi:MAG: hypothetical protein EON93_09580, partial [Burkholderiales bacterium]
MLDESEKRLFELENALLDTMRATGAQAPNIASLAAPPTARSPAGALTGSEPVATVPDVGEKPTERKPVQDVAVLAEQGSVLTRAGRFTVEPTIEYARVDRNRFV